MAYAENRLPYGGYRKLNRSLINSSHYPSRIWSNYFIVGVVQPPSTRGAPPVRVNVPTIILIIHLVASNCRTPAGTRRGRHLDRRCKLAHISYGWLGVWRNSKPCIDTCSSSYPSARRTETTSRPWLSHSSRGSVRSSKRFLKYRKK